MKTGTKKVFLLLVLIVINIGVIAQAAIYKTYEDYKSGNSEIIEDVTKAWWSSDSFGDRVVFEIENKKKLKVKLKDFWGFKYKGRLFRSINKGYKDLVCVVDSGKVIFYLNGGAQLTLLKEGSKFGFYDQASNECFVSLNYESDIYYTHWNSYTKAKQMATRTKKRFNEFKEMYPQFKALYECIGDTYETSVARKCIEDFNKNK
jgi:hypothetical protein